MNYGKMSKTGVSMLLIIISVAILIIPPAAIMSAETLTVQNIMTVQGEYVNGTNILTSPLNQTAINDAWSIATVLGESPTNDTGFYGHKTTGLSNLRDSIYWADFQTYLGNGTYEMNVNYSLVPSANYTARHLIVQLDITSTDWLGYDFIKIYTNYSDAILMYFIDATGAPTVLQPMKTANDEYICINTLSFKSLIQANPESNIFLTFEIDELTEPEAIYDFQIQGYNLGPADALSWTEDQMYVLTLMGCDILLIVGFIFTTNFVDIAIDHKSGKKSGKRRK